MTMYRRQHSSSSIASSTCSLHSETDNTAATVAAPPFNDRSRQASTCSERSCGGMSLNETKDLWRCMLELQQRYACYNSTRIDLALDAGDEGFDLMPNPFIIDTLNDSVVDLPDEGWEMLNSCLRHDAAASTKDKSKRKFWTRT